MHSKAVTTSYGPACTGCTAGVSDVEPHPVAEAGFVRRCGGPLRPTARRRRTRRRRVGVGQRDADRGPAQPAADVGDTPAGAQRGVEVGHRRQVGRTEAVQEHGPVRRGLRLPGVVTVLRPGHAVAGAVGLQQGVSLLAQAGDQPRQGQDVVQAELVGQRLRGARTAGRSGGSARRRPGSATRNPVTACCSSHSRA